MLLSALLLFATCLEVAPAGVLPTPAVKLANGVQMPKLAMGVWQYNDSIAETAVLKAIKAGFRMVDTAFNYYNQEGVGRAVRASGIARESIFVETKVPGCGENPVVVTDCYGSTEKTLAKDLELLGMPYVDLVIVHSPPRAAMVARTCSAVCQQIRDQWRAMEAFYRAGKAKAIGVSNYCESCLQCLDGVATVRPMVNQIGFHIGMGPDPSGFKSAASRRGMVLQAYSPLGNRGGSTGPDDEIMHGEFTSGLAKAHNKSTIQIALKWLVQSDVPVVTKSNSAEHLAADLDLWSWSLTEDEMVRADNYRHAGRPSVYCDVADLGKAELVV